MDKCSFYQVDVKNIQSKEISNNTAAIRLSVPWCSHKHSPVGRKHANMVGGANLLKCAGVMQNCPLSDEKLCDV